jgi:reactive chlorine resistance protein C
LIRIPHQLGSSTGEEVCAVGSFGANAMFLTTLSFLRTMPGAWQEEHRFPALSLEGRFLAKDGVFLGALILTAAESLREAREA